MTSRHQSSTIFTLAFSCAVIVDGISCALVGTQAMNKQATNPPLNNFIEISKSCQAIIFELWGGASALQPGFCPAGLRQIPVLPAVLPFSPASRRLRNNLKK